MKKSLLAIVIILSGLNALASIADFDQMDTFKCEIEETMYNTDNSIVSKNTYKRIYRFDDSSNQVYLQKSPVDYITKYGSQNVEFQVQTLTDDFIMNSSININRQTGEYISDSVLNYDNPAFGQRTSKAKGVCTQQK